MEILEIVEALGGEVVVRGNETKSKIQKIFAGDRISDLIHNSTFDTLIVTHLNHVSVVQLYQIFDVPAICLVGDLEPLDVVVEGAQQNEAFLIVSPYEMFETCGMIYDVFKSRKNIE